MTVFLKQNTKTCECTSGHRKDLNNANYKGSTTLSKYVWKLKEERKAFQIKWKIIDRAPPYNPMTRKCNLCIKEKFYIIYRPNMATLNKRNELFNSCRHRHSTLLAKAWEVFLCKYYLSTFFFPVSFVYFNVFHLYLSLQFLKIGCDICQICYDYETASKIANVIKFVVKKSCEFK